MRTCAIIPTYENPQTIEAVVQAVRAHIPDVIVVDDGSSEPTRAVVRSLAERGLATVDLRAKNGGKGAAVKTGLLLAQRLGFTHALQIDADGQHDVADIPNLLAVSRAEPRALVLGQPIFDDTAPKARLYARRLSILWCSVETLSKRVGDPLCGFRVYPVDAALDVRARGDAMDFDPEVAVRLVWAGHPVVHVPTRVRYLAARDGGVSHYRGFLDTLLISWMHTRLVVIGALRLLTWPLRATTR
jgi:glycosyltransferase involved in cell wall biosynthesis